MNELRFIDELVSIYSQNIYTSWYWLRVKDSLSLSFSFSNHRVSKLSCVTIMMIVLFTSLRMRPRVFWIQFVDGFYFFVQVKLKGYVKKECTRVLKQMKMAKSVCNKMQWASKTASTYNIEIDEHTSAHKPNRKMLENWRGMFWITLRDVYSVVSVLPSTKIAKIIRWKWTWTYHARSIEICNRSPWYIWHLLCIPRFMWSEFCMCVCMWIHHM